MPPTASTTNRMLRRLVFWLVVVFIVASAWAYQPVANQLILRHANPVMAALATQAGMSKTGELLFLKAQPELDSDPQMEINCPAAAANSNGFIEQGCYNPETGRIYLRRMPQDLQELEATTAAYEMLHIVYLQNTQSGNGSALNQAIEANYARLHDQDLDTQVSNFAKTEPGDRDLELFSLLGTEYSDLSSDLAAYYSQYFTNLAANIAGNTAVQARFNNDQSQLAQLKGLITQQSSMADASYNQSVSWAHDGNAAEDNYYYNLYTREIAVENNTISQYNQLITQYNALVTEYDGTQPVSQISTAQVQGAAGN